MCRSWPTGNSGREASGCHLPGDFPNSLVTKNVFSLLRAWVQFLVGKLRSHKQCGKTEKKKKATSSLKSFLIACFMGVEFDCFPVASQHFLFASISTCLTGLAQNRS